MYELVRYRASMGELLALGCGSLTEALLWRREREGRSHSASDEMCQRAMAELTAYFLLAAGHALVNITARTLAMENDLRPLLLDRVGTGMPVGTTERREHSLGVNSHAVRDLRRVARQSVYPSMAQIVVPVSVLVSDSQWNAMFESRGMDFHRLRPQSHGIAAASSSFPRTFKGRTKALEGVVHTEPDSATAALTTLNLAIGDYEALLGKAVAEIAEATRLRIVKAHQARGDTSGST